MLHRCTIGRMYGWMLQGWMDVTCMHGWMDGCMDYCSLHSGMKEKIAAKPSLKKYILAN